MTRSKIQKMKFFIFLLIFLLAQTVVCNGSFREKKIALAIEDKKTVAAADENKETNEQADKPGPEPVDAKKPVVEDKTHDNITSKSSSSNENKTVHTVDSEVCILLWITSRLLRSFTGFSDTLSHQKLPHLFCF